MKPSSRDPQLGLASPLNYAANKSGKIKSPSKKEAGAGCKSPALASREGTGEICFLDILFHRMSEMEMLRQLRRSSRRGNFQVTDTVFGTRVACSRESCATAPWSRPLAKRCPCCLCTYCGTSPAPHRSWFPLPWSANQPMDRDKLRIHLPASTTGESDL